jgi:uncharacterized SAM-binding protein YcdF (DUF218 family)
MSRRKLLAAKLLGAAVVIVVGMVGLLTVMLFVWPVTPEPQGADAVFVLSGDHGERLAVALRLIERGVAPTLVLDGEPDFDRVRTLCGERQTFEVVCLRPPRDSTRAEARAGRDLASARAWRRVVVVTSTAHVTRAGLWFRRCIGGSVRGGSVSMVKAHRRPSAGAVVHEWLGLAQALVLARSC